MEEGETSMMFFLNQNWRMKTKEFCATEYFSNFNWFLIKHALMKPDYCNYFIDIKCYLILSHAIHYSERRVGSSSWLHLEFSSTKIPFSKISGIYIHFKTSQPIMPSTEKPFKVLYTSMPEGVWIYKHNLELRKNNVDLNQTISIW